MRLAGHVARVREKRNVYGVSRERKGQRPLGRPSVKVTSCGLDNNKNIKLRFSFLCVVGSNYRSLKSLPQPPDWSCRNAERSSCTRNINRLPGIMKRLPQLTSVFNRLCILLHVRIWLL